VALFLAKTQAAQMALFFGCRHFRARCFVTLFLAASR
jgi:hypothetical protein